MRCRAAGSEPIAPPVSSLTPRPIRSGHHDARSATRREHEQQIASRERNATFCRPVSRPGHMHEDGAARALHSRSPVVVKHNDHIVEAVLAPETLGARWIRVADRAIVVTVADGVAPPVIGLERAHRKWRPWPPDTIGAIEHRDGLPLPARCRPVALALPERAAPSPEGTWQDERSQAQPAPRRRSRASGNPQPATISPLCAIGRLVPSSPDCHLRLESCFHSATSDMLHRKNSPIRSVAT